MVLSFRLPGTSPFTIRWASPSAMAVLPHTWLADQDWVILAFRERIRMTLRIHHPGR